MHSLKHAPRPGATLVSIRSIEFRFRVIYVGINHRTIGADRNDVLAARFTCGDEVGFARTNVVVRGDAPRFTVFVEPCDENGLFRFFVQPKIPLADDRRKDKIVGFTKCLESSEYGGGTYRNSTERCTGDITQLY